MKKIILILYFGIISCSNINNPNKEVNKSEIDSIEYFKKRVINIGDTIAYNKISLHYTFNLVPWPLLFYSQIMCNKYKYPFACYDCYLIYAEKYTGENLKANDSLSKNFGIYYLLKAKEMGYKEAQDELKDVFRNSKIPTASDYLKIHISE